MAKATRTAINGRRVFSLPVFSGLWSCCFGQVLLKVRSMGGREDKISANSERIVLEDGVREQPLSRGDARHHSLYTVLHHRPSPHW